MLSRGRNTKHLWLITLFLVSCAKRPSTHLPPLKPETFTLPQVPYTWPAGEISIRVGLGEYTEIFLLLEDSFYIYLGNTLKFQGTKSPLRVTIQKTRPATFNFYVSYGDYETLKDALEKAQELSQKGITVKIREIGRNFKGKKEKLSTVSYLLYQGPFKSQEEALRLSSPERKAVFKEVKNPPYGVIKLSFSDATYESEDVVRIVSKLPIKISNFRKKDHYTGGNGSRPFLATGIIEIRPSNEGKLLLINELGLETYVEGVLKGEVPASFPREALKAQSVAARTNALATLSKKLSIYHEPYDVTADIFTQNFEGFNNDPYIKSIVESTKGEVLVYQGKIIPIFYHSSCGGALASSKEIFGKDLDFYQAREDANPGSNLFLYSESDVRRFIDNPRKAHCDYQGNRYYRWERTLSPWELSQIIKTKYGKDLGEIVNVRVTKRGPSGRAQVLYIEGTRESMFVEGDFEIRKVLDRNLLPSSLFYIDNLGSQFLIRGAGFGHGVGMCQFGSASMASRGKDYREILKFYYPGTKIEKIY